MKFLAIDIETYSDIDLVGCGVYKYAASPNFEILLLAYSVDDEPTFVVDMANGEKLPKYVLAAITDPAVTKTAFNANFERTCISQYFRIDLPPEQWRCTMVHALALGLPGSLDGVSKALKVKATKNESGKRLIRTFSKPNKDGERVSAQQKPEQWAEFIEYCRQDVVVESEVRKKLERFPLNESEWALWAIDQRINDKGIRVHSHLVDNAIKVDAENYERLEAEAKAITGIQNPNSIQQLKTWMQNRGLEIDALTKETVKATKAQTDDKTVLRVLEIRQEMAKTSVSKYDAMSRAKGNDDRVRGLLQFYGASRTGRWAGRLVQVQNLPQNKMPNLDDAREAVLHGDAEIIEMIFGSVPNVLSELVRTAFIPSEGNRFIVADFSAIEARVIAWLAGEKWRQDVFASHGKIYEASAAQMFKVQIESIDKGSPLRQKGKIAELALGYQGGSNAMRNMGAEKMGLTETEINEVVRAWRDANPAIVKLWGDVENAARNAIIERKTFCLQNGISLRVEAGVLFIALPSGRNLSYAKPAIELDKRFGREKITYEGNEQGTKTWGRVGTYGGKIVENIVQAVARDCLAESLVRLYCAGYEIVMHVHDEIVVDVPRGRSSAQEVSGIMGAPIEWANGLFLTADAYECNYYMKD